MPGTGAVHPIKTFVALPKCLDVHHHVHFATDLRGTMMAKAYWIATYRSVSNPDALATRQRPGTNQGWQETQAGMNDGGTMTEESLPKPPRVP